MRKILMGLVVLAVSGCVTEYYIPLSDVCMDKKIVELKETELKKEKVVGRSFEVVYDAIVAKNTKLEKDDGLPLPYYRIGVIKFDAKKNIKFVPATELGEKRNTMEQLEAIEKFQDFVKGINTNKYIEVVFMRPFDIDCYSGGGSVNIPYWLIEQEVRFKVGIDEPMFLSALEYYLKNEKKIYLRRS